MKQLVEAAMDLQSENIFHQDIKLENILIEIGADVPRLRLINFGISCFAKKNTLCRTFYGTLAYIPPEWYQCWSYRAGSTTVWQLGVVLFDMLHVNTQFETSMFLDNQLYLNEGLNPQRHPSLEQLWLQLDHISHSFTLWTPLYLKPQTPHPPSSVSSMPTDISPPSTTNPNQNYLPFFH